jgi:hypothetical protein
MFPATIIHATQPCQPKFSYQAWHIFETRAAYRGKSALHLVSNQTYMSNAALVLVCILGPR